MRWAYPLADATPDRFGARRQRWSLRNPWSPDLRASYVLIEANDAGYEVHLRRVAYDRGAAIAAVRNAHHPSGDFIIGCLGGERAPWWESKIWPAT